MKGRVLQDIFLFFARYPKIEGVLSNFTIKTGSLEYTKFQQEVEGLTKHSIYPEIKDYVFGIDEKEIAKKIQLIRGLYLFVDYGVISTNLDNMNVKHDEMDFAITIAQPNKENVNPILQLLEIDNMLSIMSKIRDDIRRCKDNPFVKMLSFPNDIIPFDSPGLSKSYGWTMVFKVKGVDIV